MSLPLGPGGPCGPSGPSGPSGPGCPGKPDTETKTIDSGSGISAEALLTMKVFHLLMKTTRFG